MKWTKVMVLVLALSTMGGSVLSAEASSQEVKLIINGQEVKEGGYVIDGTTYVPIRDFNGLVTYDSSTGKVQFEQPNVHIFLFKGDTVFGNVNKGKLKFNVFSQIDSLTTDIAAVKIAITDPAGNVKDIQTQEIIGKQKDNFWFRTHDFTYDFKTAGKYRVGFYIKETSDSGFMLISEKVITALDS
ncbi:copper amine oxidase [Paenibacillus sp. P96]|uniref:Copper amine oxidase n=1 Tax=Paenibacillus zeirhizosphaerae TaxID=2987519 RepID=A0ABT9FQ57_9BACL|nr:copper amine oxidase [Paenibacillus sp. P96]MDP4096871.1 copper amine oxidase [Paenibacillus sp. P96]